MFVHNTAVLLKPPAETLTSLNAEVKAQTGIHFRRVNRFILLAICGAHHCAEGQVLPTTTAVWVTTENGTVGDTEKGLGQLFGQRIYPKPYNFINTMSNTASFYIAQSLKLDSPNMTIACKDFAFERGLILARSDLRRGAATGALIGGVDEAVFSETNLQSRFGDQLRDGSAWLYLTDRPDGARGMIRDIFSFNNPEEISTWLKTADLPQNPVLAYGVRVSTENKAEWQLLLPKADIFDHIAAHGYFDSAPAAAICLFFEQFKNRTCLHINKDIYGRFMIVVVEVH